MPEANTIQAAARALRSHLRMSQQSMATKLGLSMGALRNYESGLVKTPEPRPLYAYLLESESCERPDLASVFRRELYHVLAIPDEWSGHLPIEPRDSFEQVLVAAMLASIRRDEGFAKFQQPVFRALEAPCRQLGAKLPPQKAFQDTWQRFTTEAPKRYEKCPRTFFFRNLGKDKNVKN